MKTAIAFATLTSARGESPRWVLDLARSGAARGLPGAFDDVPQAVHAAGAEAAANGVERQFAVELDTPVLDEVERLAFLVETVGLSTATRCEPLSCSSRPRRLAPCRQAAGIWLAAA